jgi:transposase
MLHLSPSCRYYLYCGDADMRKGFDSLSGVVSQHMKLSALSGSVFIFVNRRRNQLKLLLWEGDGFSLYHKRLEQGTFELPGGAAPSKDKTNGISLTHQQLQLILQGISLKSVKHRKRYQHPAEKQAK